MLFVHSPEEAQRAKRRDFLIHFILFHFYSHSSKSSFQMRVINNYGASQVELLALEVKADKRSSS